MLAILDMIGFLGGIGQGIAALVAIGLIFTGQLTLRNFTEKEWWL